MTTSAPPREQVRELSQIRPKTSPWRYVTWVVGGIVLAQVVYLLVTTPNFEWGVVAEWLTAPSVLRGLLVTLELTVICMAVGIVIGVVLAVFRLSSNKLLQTIAIGYISFFRAVPALVQLIFWYNLGALFPHLWIGLPFGGAEILSWKTNDLISPFTAAVLGMGLAEGAFMSEIVRGGILSVAVGQSEASAALGMSKMRTFFRVILPQAMTFIVPPTGNQVISMVKGTSLVSTIAMGELLYSVQAVYNRTFQTIPLLLVACIWYIVVTAVLYVGQSWIEAHYARRKISFSWLGYRRSLRIRQKEDKLTPVEKGTGFDEFR